MEIILESKKEPLMGTHDKFSFMKTIFNGHINEGSLHHYPFFNTNREEDYRIMANAIADWMKNNVDSKKFDQEKKLPEETLQGMKEMGLFGLIIPENFGGSEFTQTFYTRTLELLSQFDASVTLTAGAHSSIGLKGLYLYGTEDQKKKYMPKLASGEMIASFALTETTAGSDAAGIKTRAVKKDDFYYINGSKLWITNGSFADFFTVFAKEEVNGEDKITAFIVTRDMGGVTTGPEEHKLGIKASSTVEVFFKDVKVPVNNILGKSGDGFKIAMGILNQGRLGLAGGSLGSMQNVFQESMEYSKNRKSFGQSICEFNAIQNILYEMAQDIYIVESIVYFATNLVDSGDTDYSIEAAICKVHATELAWKTINNAMQIHGGNGYMVDYGIERKLRDCRIGLIFEGTNEILRLFIAMTGIKEIATQYQRAGKEIQSVKNLDFLNDAISRIGFLSEFALQEIKKSVIHEKIEGLHQEFESECEILSESVQILSTSASKLIRTYGKKLVDEQQQLIRLADISIDTYIIACVLCRINSVVEKFGGLEKNKEEIQLAKIIIFNSQKRIKQKQELIKSNFNEEVKNITRKILDENKYLFSIDNVR